MEPEWNQSGTGVEPEWTRSGTRVEPECNQSGTRVEPDELNYFASVIVRKMLKSKVIEKRFEPDF